MKKNLDEFLSEQSVEETGLFAVDAIPDQPDMVRIFIYPGGNAVACQSFLEIPKDAIDSVVPTRRKALCLSKELTLVNIVFKEGETARLHLSTIFRQLRHNAQLSLQLESNLPYPGDVIKSRRGAQVDAVVPRLKGVASELEYLTPFNRPIL